MKHILIINSPQRLKQSIFWNSSAPPKIALYRDRQTFDNSIPTDNSIMAPTLFPRSDADGAFSIIISSKVSWTIDNINISSFLH